MVTFGITPAYAGKSTLTASIWLLASDHPRLCGEKRTAKRFAGSGGGSPPPMRGKAAIVLADRRKKRITPAYAGKRQQWSRRCKNGEDHPRLCGEKFASSVLLLVVIGSPPPMRGKVCLVHVYKCALRITPAYAGKRLKLFCKVVGHGDHPRLCGEKA